MKARGSMTDGERERQSGCSGREGKGKQKGQGEGSTGYNRKDPFRLHRKPRSGGNRGLYG